MDRFNQWSIAMIGAAYAAVLASILAQGWKALVALGLVAIAVTAYLLFRRAVWLRKPRAEIEPGITKDTVVPLSPSVPCDAEGHNARIAYLNVRNAPLKGYEYIFGAYVTLRYLDESTGEVLHEGLNARWSFRPHPASVVETTVPYGVDLFGSHYKYAVDIGFKVYGESTLYFLNDESRFLSKGYRERSLGNGPVLVEARLCGATSGPHVDETVTFRLRTADDGRDLIVERVSEASEITQFLTKLGRKGCLRKAVEMRLLGLAEGEIG